MPGLRWSGYLDFRIGVCFHDHQSRARGSWGHPKPALKDFHQKATPMTSAHISRAKASHVTTPIFKRVGEGQWPMYWKCRNIENNSKYTNVITPCPNVPSVMLSSVHTLFYFITQHDGPWLHSPRNWRSEMLSHLPWVTQLVDGKARLPASAPWFLDPSI